MSSTRGVDPALASSKGGLITTSRAAFVLFVGAFTLWKVHSQQIYEKEKKEWLSFVAWRTREKIEQGLWDDTVIQQYESAEKERAEKPTERHPELFTPSALTEFRQRILSSFSRPLINSKQ